MRFAEAKKEDFTPELLEKVRVGLHEKEGCIIFGSTGTGKTHALYAIANHTKEKVENFVAMLVEFRDYMHRGIYFEKIKELQNQKTLFIDDLGAEKTSEFVVEFLYLIFNGRYVKGNVHTVITTNLTLDEIEERYGSRIVSRMSEMLTFINLTGDDKRISNE